MTNISNKSSCALVETPLNSSLGFTVLEALVALVIFSVAAMGLCLSYSTSMIVAKMTEAHHAASSLAASKIETLSAIDPLLLDSADNESNVPVVWEGLSVGFIRSTAVTINADGSRSVAVDVSTIETFLPASVHFETRFALWE